MSRRKSIMVMSPLLVLMISGAFETESGGAGQVTPLNAAMRNSSVDITRSSTVDISAELSRTRALLEAVIDVLKVKGILRTTDIVSAVEIVNSMGLCEPLKREAALIDYLE